MELTLNKIRSFTYAYAHTNILCKCTVHKYAYASTSLAVTTSQQSEFTDLFKEKREMEYDR